MMHKTEGAQARPYRSKRHPTARSAPVQLSSQFSVTSSVNSNETHPILTQIEVDVLWEYAKFDLHIKGVHVLPIYL